MTDREKLKQFVHDHRARGWFARDDQADGFRAIPQPVLKEGRPFLIWDAAETPKAFGDDDELVGQIHFHHRTVDADEILRDVKAAGFDAFIDAKTQVVVGLPF